MMHTMMKGHLREKRNELIWALSLPEQGYNHSEIGEIFNNMNRSTIKRIVDKRPKEYKAKWVKAPEEKK